MGLSVSANVTISPATFAFPSPLHSWKTLKIGAGGFLRGLDIAADGTKVVRTDTYGAYWYNSAVPNSGNAGGTGCWQQLTTTTSMPAGYNGLLNGQGIFEIVIAPSNTSIFYMNSNGNVFYTSDRGSTWTLTNFPHSSSTSSAGPTDSSGRYMAVDPQNPNICYVCTPSDGTFATADGGNTWTGPIGTLGTGTGFVAFDQTSAVSGGIQQGIYVFVAGSGLYHSTNGGSTWTLTSGGPTASGNHMICDQNGAVWLVDSSGHLNKYSGGSWSTFSALNSLAGGNLHAVAVDPGNANNIWVSTYGGALYGSTNGGSSWGGPATITLSATDIPWLANTNESYFSSGDIKFDPSQSSVLCFSQGFGFWKTTPSTSAVTWTSVSSGVEQLVSNRIISPPGGNPIAAVWDCGVFQVANPSVYPSNHGINYTYEIQACWDVDWAPSTTFLAALVNAPYNGTNNTSGYSTDGGASWSTFSSSSFFNPTNNNGGGCIAVSTATNIIIQTGAYYSGGWVGGGAYYTSNAGSIWTECSVSGVPETDAGWFKGYYLDRRNLCADRVTAGTFYRYNDGTGAAAAPGVYKTTNGGATWSKVHTGELGPGSGNSQYNMSMECAPGVAGDIYFTCGQLDGNPSGNDLFESTDAGATWNAVANVTQVFCFGFGAAKPGGSGYPAVFIYGLVSGTLGIWRSDDHCATWTSISDGFPLGSFDKVKTISGDNNTYEVCYVGFAGSGFACYL